MATEIFTRKRVGSLTLGEKLKKIRSDHRISLGEVSRSTKIQARYLEALESGEYGNLPPDVYVRGFLRSYASFLGVPEDAILKLYDRERSIQKNLGNVDVLRFQPKVPIVFARAFSPKALVIAAIAVLIIIFFSYLYLEFRAFVSEPRLSVFDLVDQGTVFVPEVVIRGETDPRAVVTINGEESTVDENGIFSERIVLAAGMNTLDISSMNRFGKKKTKAFTIRFEDDAAIRQDEKLPSMVDAPDSEVNVSIRVERMTTLSVKVDGELVFNGELPSGGTKSFGVKSSVSVSSGIGEATFVRIGDGSEERLSGSNSPAETVFDVKGDPNASL